MDRGAVETRPHLGNWGTEIDVEAHNDVMRYMDGVTLTLDVFPLVSARQTVAA